MFIPVIMAGGSGTRLWPLSRQLRPKQFLPLLDEQTTMLQATVQRLAGLEHAPPLLICNEEHRFLAAEQMRQIGCEDALVLLEPAGRNTAPAITLAALQASAQGDDPILLVLAADHLLKDVPALHSAIHAASVLATEGRLVTFGIVPSHAETGYGYVQRGKPLSQGAFEVARFVEKPTLDVAQGYVDGGEHFWNSGMFMFRASAYLAELARLRPGVLQACQQALTMQEADRTFLRVDRAAFEACESISVDYAVMEHTALAAVVPLDAGWSDFGSWDALGAVSPRDPDGNALRGDVIALKTSNSLVHAGSRLVATLGLEGVVVVETPDAVLVASREQVQNVKQVVEQLQAARRPEAVNHREVFRPWGKYDSVDAGARYQVKRITVAPGAKLSLQMHHHRAEHWIVVSGTARVTNGDKTYLVAENESTYIPIGQKHSLENPGVIPLELIEVQSGAYLGEDDIVRFEDRYGRTPSKG